MFQVGIGRQEGRNVEHVLDRLTRACQRLLEVLHFQRHMAQAFDTGVKDGVLVYFGAELGKLLGVLFLGLLQGVHGLHREEFLLLVDDNQLQELLAQETPLGGRQESQALLG